MDTVAYFSPRSAIGSDAIGSEGRDLETGSQADEAGLTPAEIMAMIPDAMTLDDVLPKEDSAKSSAAEPESKKRPEVKAKWQAGKRGAVDPRETTGKLAKMSLSDITKHREGYREPGGAGERYIPAGAGAKAKADDPKAKGSELVATQAAALEVGSKAKGTSKGKTPADRAISAGERPPSKVSAPQATPELPPPVVPPKMSPPKGPPPAHMISPEAAADIAGSNKIAKEKTKPGNFLIEVAPARSKSTARTRSTSAGSTSQGSVLKRPAKASNDVTPEPETVGESGAQAADTRIAVGTPDEEDLEPNQERFPERHVPGTTPPDRDISPEVDPATGHYISANPQDMPEAKDEPRDTPGASSSVTLKERPEVTLTTNTGERLKPRECAVRDLRLVS